MGLFRPPAGPPLVLRLHRHPAGAVSLAPIGIANLDGSVTLSPDEAAWLRTLMGRITTVYGEANAMPRTAAVIEVVERVKAGAVSACAHKLAEDSRCPVWLKPWPVDREGTPVDGASPYVWAIRHRVELTVIAGGVPERPDPRRPPRRAA